MDPNIFYSGLFPPQRMCAQVDEDQLVQFISYWVMYNKPCVLKFIPSEKAPSLVGICFTVKNDDRATMEFIIERNEVPPECYYEIMSRTE